MKDMGILWLALRSMRSHPTRAIIQAKGCNLLGNLAKDAGNGTLVYHEGLATIVAAKDDHPHDENVQCAFWGVIFVIIRVSAELTY
jgi:hypothetical protein